MNNKNISVKAGNASFLSKGLMWLMLMVLAMVCAFIPVFAGIEGTTATALRVVGWVVFAISAAVFIMLIVREINPEDAIVLNSHGFKENLHLAGAEVEWTNVAAVGIYGTKKSPLFGITLENNDIVLDGLRKRAADEMRENIEENLPSVLISQGEVRMPLRELRDLFNRFIREARTLEDNNQQQKQKVNPFSTEDVLRAFGQYSGEEKKSSEDSGVQTKIHSAGTDDSDEFYASLRAMVGSDEGEKKQGESAAAETSEAHEDDGMPDELKEILSKAKSHKIAELGKLLSDKEVPYSALRNAGDDLPAPEKPGTEVKTDAGEPDDGSAPEETYQRPDVNATKIFEPVKPAEEQKIETEEALTLTSQIERIARDGLGTERDHEEDSKAEDDEQPADLSSFADEDEPFVDDFFSEKAKEQKSADRTAAAERSENTPQSVGSGKQPKPFDLPRRDPNTVNDEDLPGLVFIHDD